MTKKLYLVFAVFNTDTTEDRCIMLFSVLDFNFDFLNLKFIFFFLFSLFILVMDLFFGSFSFSF